MDNFNIKSLTQEQKETRRRILEISYKRKLSHLGSCLGSVDLIDAIYKVKAKEDKFVLSNGHAGIALYAVLEKKGIIKDPDIIDKLHVHPDRNKKIGIFVSTGSLGQGLPIALGFALANKKEDVYCLISDGECAEGSIWETLKIAKERNVKNLKIILNANGWGAYGSIDPSSLAAKIEGFGYKTKKIDGHNSYEITKALKSIKEDGSTILFAQTSTNQFSFLKGLDAHYYIMNENNFKEALNLLK